MLLKLPILVSFGCDALSTSIPRDYAFAGWQEFVDAAIEPDGFYLSDAGVAVQTIRASAWWDRPVFAAPHVAAAVGLDGYATWEDAVVATERARGLRAGLGLDPRALQYDEKILYFLYLREPAELVPQLDCANDQLYVYPAAQALAAPGTDVQAWITALTRRGLLESSRLIDRTRHCVRCYSARQHYLDVCPHCASLHIHKGSSLHCFSCGHVAPEAEFMGERGVQCTKCTARLRHIGVDYDRPLTQYTCAACHHAFVEAAVKARCLDCGDMADPGSLAVKEVAVLRLTLRGRAALRAGHFADTFSALEGVGLAPLHQFKSVASWALATQSRHSEFAFAVVLVELTNVKALLEAHGGQATYLMLDEFARRLRELLRTSDLATRTSEDRIWLLLPYCSVPGFEARLGSAVHAIQHGEGPPIAIRFVAVAAPHGIPSGEHIDGLMARLQTVQR